MEKMRTSIRFKLIIRSALLALLFSLLCPSYSYTQAGEKQQENKTYRWSFFSHDKTNFPLIGQHRVVPCAQCHLNFVFEGTPTSCEACHWDRRQDDRYQLHLGAHCEECHTPFSWKNVPPGKWDHSTHSGYSLAGIHKTLDCLECHSADGFWMEKVDCFHCHENEYFSVKDPDHQAGEFPLDCRICHLNEVSWQNAQFNHSLFPLQGSHRIIKCSQCHQNDIYKGLPMDCFACHMDDYNRAKDPDHLNLNFPTLCEMCHNPNAYTWQDAKFLHTQFPLKGKHLAAQCSDCHKNDLYEGLPSDCVFCHLDDYLNAKNPNHKQLGFHTDCQVCHGTDAVSWKKTTFQAFFFHRFPLKGSRHAVLNCLDCHPTSEYHIFSCLNCHSHEKHRMDIAHSEIPGYIFASQACLGCHYSGRK